MSRRIGIALGLVCLVAVAGGSAFARKGTLFEGGWESTAQVTRAANGCGSRTTPAYMKFWRSMTCVLGAQVFRVWGRPAWWLEADAWMARRRW